MIASADSTKEYQIMKKAICVALFLAAAGCTHIAPTADTHITIALIGDSTVTDKAGWGKAFAGRFAENVKVLNFSVGGRSSKSWYNENRLTEVLKAEPDYVFIQFGHNDQPNKGPKRKTDPATTYRDYLTLYVNEFRKTGATPIIVSSVTRRRFDNNGKITSIVTPWAESAKAVARTMKVPFVDLHARSVEYHNKIGREASMTFNPQKEDTTHFNKKGAEAITDLIIKEIKPVAPELYEQLKDPTE